MSHLITQRFDTGSTTEAYIPWDSLSDDQDLYSLAYATIVEPTDNKRIRRFNTGSDHDADIPTGPKGRSCRRQTPEQRAESMAHCGDRIIMFDPFTGMVKTTPRWCQLKECPVCGAKRGNDLRTRITEALKEHELVLSIMPHSAAAQMLHNRSNNDNYSASNYLRIPQKDGTDYIFAISEKMNDILVNPQPFTYHDINKIDWTIIQNTHDDYVTSGKLGHAAKTMHEPGMTMIPTVQVSISSDDKSAVEEIIWDVLAKTYYYDPKTKEDAIFYSRRKVDMLIHEMDQRNIQYKLFRGSAYGNLSCLDWINGNYHTLPFLVQRGLVSQGEIDSFLVSLDPQRLSRIEEDNRIELIPDGRVWD